MITSARKWYSSRRWVMAQPVRVPALIRDSSMDALEITRVSGAAIPGISAPRSSGCLGQVTTMVIASRPILRLARVTG